MTRGRKGGERDDMNRHMQMYVSSCRAAPFSSAPTRGKAGWASQMSADALPGAGQRQTGEGSSVGGMIPFTSDPPLRAVSRETKCHRKERQQTLAKHASPLPIFTLFLLRDAGGRGPPTGKGVGGWPEDDALPDSPLAKETGRAK